MLLFAPVGFIDGIAQPVAAAPYGLDVVLVPGGRVELLAQRADEDVDDPGRAPQGIGQAPSV